MAWAVRAVLLEIYSFILRANNTQNNEDFQSKIKNI